MKNQTYLLIDKVGEYRLPPAKHATIRTWYNGYETEQIFSDAGFKEPQIKLYQQRVLDKRLMDNKKHHHYLMPDPKSEPMEPFDNIYALTIWEDHHDEYITSFKHYIQNLFANRGADDDYYDYLPSVTDMYRQLTDMLDRPKDWRDLCQLIYELEGPDWFQEGCYTDEPIFKEES